MAQETTLYKIAAQHTVKGQWFETAKTLRSSPSIQAGMWLIHKNGDGLLVDQEGMRWFRTLEEAHTRLVHVCQTNLNYHKAGLAEASRQLHLQTKRLDALKVKHTLQWLCVSYLDEESLGELKDTQTRLEALGKVLVYAHSDGTTHELDLISTAIDGEGLFIEISTPPNHYVFEDVDDLSDSLEELWHGDVRSPQLFTLKPEPEPTQASTLRLVP